jgi:hypothetical protein
MKFINQFKAFQPLPEFSCLKNISLGKKERKKEIALL